MAASWNVDARFSFTKRTFFGIALGPVMPISQIKARPVLGADESTLCTSIRESLQPTKPAPQQIWRWTITLHLISKKNNVTITDSQWWHFMHWTGAGQPGNQFFLQTRKDKTCEQQWKNIVTTIIYNQWINGCFTVRPQWPKGLFKRIKPRYCSEVWALWVERLLEMPRADTLTGGSSPWSELQGAAPFLTQTPSSWCSAGMGTHSEQPQMQEGHLTAGRVQIHTELCALGGGACGHTRWWTQSSLVPRTLALVAQSSPWG